MLHYIIGGSIIKSVMPYLRKHILGTLNSDEYLLLNAFLIVIIVLIIFFVKMIRGKKVESIKTFFNNYKKLTYLQVFLMLCISCFTVLTSLFIYELDKNHNTPLINAILMRFSSLIVLLFVGIFIFNETYTLRQIFGFTLSVIGIFLFMHKDTKSK
jgi:drug/metabolite transporter (DMT)-like permease